MNEQSEGVRIAIEWLGMDAAEVMQLGREGLLGYMAHVPIDQCPTIEIDAILAWAEAAKQDRHFILFVDGEKARMKVSQLIVPVEHAFGPNAQYKGRNLKPELVLMPENLYVEEALAPGETLQEFLTRVTDSAVIAMEEVVKKADEREEARKEAVKAKVMLVLEQARRADEAAEEGSGF